MEIGPGYKPKEFSSLLIGRQRRHPWAPKDTGDIKKGFQGVVEAEIIVCGGQGIYHARSVMIQKFVIQSV